MPECTKYLERERRRLSTEASSNGRRADLFCSLASINDWFGEFSSAYLNISRAIEIEPSNVEYLWLKEKMSRQANIIELQKTKKEALIGLSPKFPEPVEVTRVSATDLTYEEFHELYVKPGKPVIVCDVAKDMSTEPFDLDLVKSKAGCCHVMVKKSVPDSVEWARLEDSRMTTVGDFVDSIEEKTTSEYLFDWSLPLHCPQLAQLLTLPKYFAGNFLLQTAPESLYHDSWPSLFIAPKGAVSNLHVDAFASHFWMMLFQGFKRWTFFDPKEIACLYPRRLHSLDPMFDVDLTNPDLIKHPLLCLTRPQQCVLAPGELLFVPAGSPHYVKNLTSSLAVSSNYVDASNIDKVCQELELDGLMNPRAKDLVSQLKDPAFLTRMQQTSGLE